MTVIEEIVHYDEFTEEAGGGVSQVNGNVGGKHITTIEGYFYRAALAKFLRFSPDGTITNINELDGDSWIELGFAVGAIITVEGTPSNDGSYIIMAISDSVITTAETFVDEDVEETDIYDDTPVTCVDFYYNLIENSESENYFSRVDSGAVQRFSSVGYDLTGEIGNDQNMLVASESFGWVTNILMDEDTGETDQVRITNVSTTDHKQYFLINHIYYIAPFCLVDQKTNFDNIAPPDYLSGGRSLKYIVKVEGNTSCGCGLTDGGHTGSKTTPNGCVAWYNQNNKRTRAEYYFDSIAMTADSVDVDQIDINKVTSVVITIKSRTGQFTEFNRIIPAFTYFPINTDRYIFTPDTLLRENFINDRGNTIVNAGIVSSDFDGTDYQVLTNVQATLVNANTITVQFDVDFSAALKTLFESLPEENRNYYFSVMTQDPSITTTLQSDRVNIIVPLAQIGWDKEIDDLIAPYDDLHVYQFPETDEIQATANVAGYEGDPIVAEFPFTLLQPTDLEPTILNAGFQIVATKSGMDDFVLEEKIFDVSLVRKLNGVQTIDEEESRGFKDMIDEYNLITLVRDSSYDITGATDSVGFIARYPFALRYEYWASLVSQADEYQYELFDEIESPTQSWDTLQSDGWVLQVKFKAQTQAYDDYIQDFTQYWDISVKTFGEAPDEGSTLNSLIIYEDPDEGIEVQGILTGRKTKITVRWSGDLSGAVYDSQYGYIFADYNGGGINNRRFASSEFDSDDDCPFQAEDLVALSGSDESWASDNVRVNVFGNQYFILQTIYDDAIENWTKTKEELLILPRIGSTYPTPIDTQRQIIGSSPALPTFENDTISVPVTIGTPELSLQPVQIVGLIPVYPCDSPDCRENCDTVCAPYKNPVFGELTESGHTMKSTYENDFSSFFFDFPLIKKNVTGFTVVFTIEKYENGAWTTAITITDNSYGVYYAFGSITVKPTYTGLSINWGAVLDNQGEGCYRLKMNMSYSTYQWLSGYTGEPTLITYTDCSASPIFDLKEFDCKKAHGTAKFEIWNTGVIGDPYNDFLKHDLCGRTLFDSIRVFGMIGFQTTPTYKMDNNKWGSPKQGQIERVRDEQIQQWQYESGLLPEYIHTRFSTFAMMSDTMFGSDYNINNSDWTIKRKNIVKSANTGYEPEWLDRTADWQKRNKGHVKVTFNRGIQSVEKYNCCTTVQITIGSTVGRP